jgi:hypothetical protein
MSRSRDDVLIPVESLDDIPSFANEDEEHEFWSTHSFGEVLLDQMGPLDDVLPPPRRRRRRFWQRIPVPAKLAANLSRMPEVNTPYARPGRVYRIYAA